MTYHSRKFLNSKTGIAAIECHADMASKGCFVTVGISDCNRTVNLDFDFSDAKGHKEKRAKLSLIIYELQALLEHIDIKMSDPEFRKGMK